MDQTAEIDSATLTALIGLVRKHTGIAMTERKSDLLRGRLRPRLRALSLGSYQDYLDLVATDRTEVQVFINMVTTNDTVFFRTPHVWEFFSNQYLPQWWRDNPGLPLKIWSAAAASGEEAYSIAMLCQEFQLRHPGFVYQIMATDISTSVLATAQAGLYAGRSVDRIKTSHPQFFAKYFKPQPDGAQIAADLKKHIRFAEHNLLGTLQPPEQFNLVFLRNVLIYFDEPNQEVVLKQIRKSMKDDASLILGESESISRIATPFRYATPLVYAIAGATP